MRRRDWMGMIIAAALAGGCTTRGLYEGLRQQEAVRNPPPPGQPAQRQPTFDEYATERRKATAP